VAAPASGSGKTTITLGLLRALSQDGVPVRGAKSGPDYIDPRFHAAACGAPCTNLDAWAMTPDRLKTLAAGSPLIIEGAMGLFDGAPPDGKGAVADLARLFDLPVILVVDAARMAQSIAPLVAGFAHHDHKVRIAGVILNKVGSQRHEEMLRAALANIGVTVLGAVMRDAALAMPSRHLGLVQAGEHPDLTGFLDHAAATMRKAISFDALPELRPMPDQIRRAITPPAQRIAVAQDAAFAFAYPHLLADWQAAGAEVRLFSPLNNDAAPAADLIYLPGGYPELYAGTLAANTRFMASLKDRRVYGECGGYMVMGHALTDADGVTHQMAGLLDLHTSFAQRKLHLGYRDLEAAAGPFQGRWKGHEFHYATTVSAKGTPLFQAKDARGTELAPMGLVNDLASGSFAHLIDRA